MVWSPLFAQSIELPVEVLGPAQTIEDRAFSISSASEASFLYLQVNNFKVEDKVEVRINEGTWTALNNGNVTIPMPERGFGGIAGGYSTIRVYYSLAGASLFDGNNVISFRFNASHDAISAGYRVIDFNITDSDKNPLIAADQFTKADPATWTAPLSDSQSIDEGEALWRTAVLTDPGLGGKLIKATCSDCHAQDGRDLKYFNFSNKSIVARSVYHALSEEEGNKIASYIRSLDIDVPAKARPWNPPYQPGPGLDSQPINEWAAGAGLEHVLQKDEEMMPYLFPNGTSDEQLAKVFDLKGTLNIREMPVAIQFPDWNAWLPQIHPKDLMSEASYLEVITGIGHGNRPAGTYGYRTVRKDLEAIGIESYNGTAEQLMNKVGDIGSGVQDFLFKDWTDAAGVFWWTVTASPGLSKNTAGVLNEVYKRNLAQWNAVKHWEIMHEFQVDHVKPDLEYAERMQWPANNWTVFAIAPHIVGDDRGSSHFIGQDRNIGLYFSTAWYQLQMVLNAGMRQPQGVAPVDWSYNFDHVLKSGIETGHLEPLRLIQNFIKCYQQRDNNRFANGNALVNKSAWNMREVSPWRLYSSASGDQTLHLALNNYEDSLHVKAATHLLRMFMEKVNSLRESDWPRGFDSWEKLEPASYTPSIYSTSNCLFPNSNGRCVDIQNAVEADAMYTLIPLLQEMGVKCEEVERLRSWSKDMWPLGDWDRYIQEECAPEAPPLSIAGSNKIQVYPNPTTHFTYLGSTMRWRLLSLSGQQLRTGNSAKVDLQGLTTGVYLLLANEEVIPIIKN